MGYTGLYKFAQKVGAIDRDGFRRKEDYLSSNAFNNPVLLLVRGAIGSSEEDTGFQTMGGGSRPDQDGEYLPNHIPVIKLEKTPGRNIFRSMIIFGRAPKCDVQIGDTHFGKTQFYVTKKGPGLNIVTGMRATNPTLLLRESTSPLIRTIEDNETASLEDGLILGVGDEDRPYVRMIYVESPATFYDLASEQLITVKRPQDSSLAEKVK